MSRPADESAVVTALRAETNLSGRAAGGTVKPAPPPSMNFRAPARAGAAMESPKFPPPVSPVTGSSPARLSISQRMNLLPNQFLGPGYLGIARNQGKLTTIVSSGVAACLWDGEAAVGGMVHFSLPDGRAGLKSCPSALDRLVAEVIRLGGNRERLRGKLFGGVRTSLTSSAFQPSLGERNCAAAEQWMREANVPLVGGEVGGQSPLRVVFCPLTGEASVEPITAAHDTPIEITV